MKYRCLIVSVVAMVSLFLGVSMVDAQAYCALRDPNAQIYDIFPTANGYRSFVQRIDSEVSVKVSELLPFHLHSKEFGRHTVYGVLKDKRHVGIVHARSERTSWGLMEIVWAFDIHLKEIHDFRIQRCRDVSCDAVRADSFRAQLRGKDFQQLRAMLTPDGLSLVPGTLTLEDRAKEFAAAVVRSAMKTMLVTDLVYGDDLRQIRFGKEE